MAQAPKKEPEKHLDILTLKKQVIAEVRAELEKEYAAKAEQDKKRHEALILQQERQNQKAKIAAQEPPYTVPKESQIDTSVTGTRNQNERDMDD